MLNVPNCWTGPFELDADFLAGVPYREGLQLRIQSGSDFQSFTDGLSILLIRHQQGAARSRQRVRGSYGQPLAVDLPPEVTPPGVPVKAEGRIPATVANTPSTCRRAAAPRTSRSTPSRRSRSRATARATLAADEGRRSDARLRSRQGGARRRRQRQEPHRVHVRRSTASSTSRQAAERLNAGCFDVYLADPREVAPGGLGPPPPLPRSHPRLILASIFERGRPSQPFP